MPLTTSELLLCTKQTPTPEKPAAALTGLYWIVLDYTVLYGTTRYYSAV